MDYMHLHVLAVIFFVQATPGATQFIGGSDDRCNKACPAGLYCVTRTFREKCYQFVLREMDWVDARSKCNSVDLTSSLVEIHDWATMWFLKRTLTRLDWKKNGVWIGASDRKDDHDWRWPSGLKVQYAYWASGNPSTSWWNHGVNDCAAMRRLDGYKWRDYPCHLPTHTYRFVCQYDKPPPIPTLKPTTPMRKTTATTIVTTTSIKITKLPTTITTTEPTVNRTVPESTTKSTAKATMKTNKDTHSKDRTTPKLNESNVIIISPAAVGKSGQTGESGKTHPAVLGAAFGIVALLVIVIVILVFVLRRRKTKSKEVRNDIYNVQYENAVDNHLYTGVGSKNNRVNSGLICAGGTDKLCDGQDSLNGLEQGAIGGVQFYEFTMTKDSGDKSNMAARVLPGVPIACHNEDAQSGNLYTRSPRNTINKQPAADEESIYAEPDDLSDQMTTLLPHEDKTVLGTVEDTYLTLDEEDVYLKPLKKGSPPRNGDANQKF